MRVVRWLLRHPDAWVPFAALGAGYGLSQLVIGTAAGKTLLSWPHGLLWPNLFSAMVYSALGALAVWLYREHLGRHLARFWDNRIVPHLPHVDPAIRERADLASIATHKIAADIYRAVNGGDDHPHAPDDSVTS